MSVCCLLQYRLYIVFVRPVPMELCESIILSVKLGVLPRKFSIAEVKD